MTTEKDARLSLSLTAEETRSLLMSRIERSLRESGVILPADVRDRIAACLPVDTATAALSLPSGRTPETPAVLPAERPHQPATDNRARAYRPTPKARPVDNPTTTASQILNLIVRSRAVCTLDDLKKGTKKPVKSIYTALWQLNRDGLIEKVPLASVKNGAGK